jgi:phage terminase small subunit
MEIDMTVSATTTRPQWTEGLSDREQAFVEAYVSTLSSTEAAERIGAGSRKSCRETGHRIRKRPRVAEAIAKLIEERTGATRSRVIEEASKLVRWI